MGARRIDLQVGEADLTSEGQMSLVMEETRRVHWRTRRVGSSLPEFRDQWRPDELGG